MLVIMLVRVNVKGGGSGRGREREREGGGVMGGEPWVHWRIVNYSHGGLSILGGVLTIINNWVLALEKN